MNLLNFIDLYILNKENNDFDIINLHTRDKEKAKEQCKKFFASSRQVFNNIYFYTYTSKYIWYGGVEYILKKSKSGLYFLIKNSFQGY